MTDDNEEIVARHFIRPQSIDGTVVDIDLGYPLSLVMIIEQDGENYYETYELVSIERKEDTV
ncbi:hypothetical protein [Halomicrococcus sp. NG-SE-24]|uniref:hypothetical protein n=1 Tax=Halomicrococcus sp. NG-SE-24 TaxID=3436928 RepID=UPI003D999CDC